MVDDPDEMWDQLAYLRLDHFDKIKDPEEKKRVEEMVESLEKDIHKQFVPFIESNILRFGWHNSPIEKYTPARKMGTEDIEELFNRANFSIDNLKLSEEDSIEFKNELEGLREKFERFIKEPTLFSFERREEELFKEHLALINLDYERFFSRSGREEEGTFEDEESTAREIQKYDKLIGRSEEIKVIAEKMGDKDTREDCVKRADHLKNWFEYYKAKFESPKELLFLEGSIKDLEIRARDKEEIGQGELDEIKVKLSELKGKADHKIDEQIKKLEQDLNIVERIMAGEDIPKREQPADLDAEGVDWAWSRLGLKRDAKPEEIKKKYRKLVQKYHPDRNKDKDARDNLSKANQAYEFIKRVVKL
jgi:hypothetical protein